MKIVKKQPVSNSCFVCGINNPNSLKLQFYETEDGEVTSAFVINENFQSFAHRIHGGVITAILDEAMGRSINVLEECTSGVIVDIRVNFAKPVLANQNLLVIARITNNDRLFFEATAEIYEGDEALVNAYGKYLKMPIEDYTGIDKPQDDWIKTELTSEEIRSFDDKRIENN